MLVERVQSDLKVAMKARDQLRVDTLRMLLAELKKVALDRSTDLTEGEETAVVQRAVKQRREAVEAFTKGDRAELAAKETAEATILEEYLPKQLSDAELDAAVAEQIAASGAASAADIGKVMGPLMKRFAGQLDGNRARAAVQKAFANR